MKHPASLIIEPENRSVRQSESFPKKEFWSSYPWFMSCSVSSNQTRTCIALPSRHHWNISSIFALLSWTEVVNTRTTRRRERAISSRSYSETASRHTLNIAMFLTLTLTRQPHYSPRAYVTAVFSCKRKEKEHSRINRNRASRGFGPRKSRDCTPIAYEWPYTNRWSETRTEDPHQ